MLATLGGYLRAAVTWCFNGGAHDALTTLDRYLQVAFFWFWVCVGILAAISSYGSYGAGLSALMLGGVFMFYAVRRLHRAFKASNVDLQDCVCVVYALAVFGVGIHGSSSFIEKHETNFAPLLAALEEYRSTNGQYPEDVAELVPDYVASLPKCPVTGSWAPELSYHKRQPGHRSQGTYLIQCVVGAFVFPQYALYESTDSTWMYTD